jgi:hypothetical protein
LPAGGSHGSFAADARRIPVGYEFATWLGTGLCRLGNRDVWIVNLPIKDELIEGIRFNAGFSF